MRLLVVLASFAAVIGLAVPAHADPSGDDAAFLAALKQAGITYQDPDRAVAVGKRVCSLADKGMTGAEIVKALQDLNPGFQGDGAAKFAAIADTAYCPQHLGEPTAQAPPPAPSSEIWPDFPLPALGPAA
jgi:Protein of unknown function (DUF732)